MTNALNRRDLIKALSLAAFAAPLALPAPDPRAPLFFTKDEFALLDRLTELLIPADEHSQGAHEAGVAGFIDRTTAEAFLPEDKQSWQKGLAAINHMAQASGGKPFLACSAEDQKALLTKISQHPNKEQTEEEKFFAQLKTTTAFAYYSTDIGIHKEMEYKGNVLLDKFVGYLPTDTLPSLDSL